MYVRLDDGFFKKERRTAYADWKFSFWRELFQNAVDQGASRINISVTDRDGCAVVRFCDDGPGMTRWVLENVYFAIGATTKGGNQIGGMGRARVLTCFAMQSYQIQSQDYIVHGNGGYYDVQEAPYTFGCNLLIEVDDTTADEMIVKLHNFLGESNIDTTVFLNDRRLTINSGHPGRQVGCLTTEDENCQPNAFATVFVNKSAARQRLLVRVNGVSMYSVETSAKGQVIVELDPTRSREMLTANRDGMRGNYQYAMNRFFRELAVDTQSAIKDRFERHTKVVHGGGMRKVRRSQENKPVAVMVSSTSEVDEYVPPPVQARSVSGTNETVTHSSPDYDAFSAWLAATFGDIYIYDETKNAAMHKVLPNYMPENWKPTVANGKTFRKGGNIAKVLLMWHVAINYALEVALEPLGRQEVNYAVGFTFQDNNKADCRSVGGGHVFSLRPVDKQGKLDYAVRQRQCLKRLMTMAKHEVTHISRSWHDEDFCGMREAIDELFDEAECFRRMKIALDKVPDFDKAAMAIAA